MTEPPSTHDAQVRAPELEPIPLRHPWRWVGGAALIALAALFVRLLVFNGNMHWDVVGDYLFDREILAGLGRTLLLTFLAMVIGLLVGMLLNRNSLP